VVDVTAGPARGHLGQLSVRLRSTPPEARRIIAVGFLPVPRRNAAPARPRLIRHARG